MYISHIYARIYARIGIFGSVVRMKGFSMREKQMEQRLVKAAKASGGICPKLVSPGMDGMPDRLVLMPGGKIGFVEVKAPGKKLRPLQELRLRQLRRLGFKAYVLDGAEQIESILGGIEDE